MPRITTTVRSRWASMALALALALSSCSAPLASSKATLDNAHPAPRGATAQDGATTVDGRRLALQAKATRSMLFMDVYSVGMYLPHPVGSVEAARNQTLPKAVRVKVLYNGTMPSGVPPGWWNEIVPALSPQQEEELRSAFSKLSSGDEVWITYTPGDGTRIRLGGEMVLSDRGHGLMDAVLNLWLGPTPVSTELHDELKRQLVAR